MKLLEKIWFFLKRPVYKSYNYPKSLKRKIVIQLLGLKVFTSIVVAMTMGIILLIFEKEVENHTIERVYQSYNPLKIFFYVIILAPIIEELLFRWPLVFLKKSRYFPYALYASILIFGFAHITNYEDFSQVIWIAPLLVLPQLIGGICLSYIRVRMGLIYSILLHASFNAVVTGPVILLKSLKLLIS